MEEFLRQRRTQGRKYWKGSNKAKEKKKLLLRKCYSQKKRTRKIVSNIYASYSSNLVVFPFKNVEGLKVIAFDVRMISLLQ